MKRFLIILLVFISMSLFSTTINLSENKSFSDNKGFLTSVNLNLKYNGKISEDIYVLSINNGYSDKMIYFNIKYKTIAIYYNVYRWYFEVNGVYDNAISLNLIQIIK